MFYKYLWIFLFVLIFVNEETRGQVSINSTGASADPSAGLDINFNNKGLLIPRLTKTQMTLISNPANGLTVFCTTDNKLYIFVNPPGIWKELPFGSEIVTQPFACGSSIVVNHVAGVVAPVTKTVTYGTVNGIPGEPTKCWITQNLGASEQPHSPNDARETSAGWYWRFNRKQGYSYVSAYAGREPGEPWSSISENSDWLAGNDPCSIELGLAWRIPTPTEWSNVDSEGNWSDFENSFQSPLKLHAAGRIENFTCTSRGGVGYFSSNLQVNQGSMQVLRIQPGFSFMEQVSKSNGHSVRCIENGCSLPGSPGVGTHVSAPTSIQWKWNAVSEAMGYRIGSTNDYNSSTDVGNQTSYTETGLPCNAPFTRYIWAYNDCGKSSPVTLTSTTGACVNVTCGQDILVNHSAGSVAPVTKSVTYGSVTNIPGETTKCWLTRNLGANQQPATVSDAAEASAGWYWQFNRKQGYKHDGTARTPASTWVTSISENAEWIAANDPCAIEVGSTWRIPTNSEWMNVDNAGGWSNWNTVFSSNLKLHAAGMLLSASGNLSARGVTGNYWSSRQSANATASALNFSSSSSAVTTSDAKAGAYPIRCLRDDCTLPAAPTSGSHSSAPTQIIWNWNPVPNVTGYKWNTVNDYATAIDLGNVTTRTETGLTCNTVYYRYIWAYRTCGNSTVLTLIYGTAACAGNFTCNQNITVNHVAGSVAPVSLTVSYTTKTAVPGEPSKCWMTRNLGASIAVNEVNTNTFQMAGWYWQFNRKQGYSFEYTRTPDILWPYNISENTGWEAANDPCALIFSNGWRIPTITEWQNVVTAGGWTNWNGPFNSLLKLHAAGFLNNITGELFSRGSIGNYWSSSQSSTTLGNRLYFNQTNVNTIDDFKTYGFSVRCIK